MPETPETISAAIFPVKRPVLLSRMREDGPDSLNDEEKLGTPPPRLRSMF